MNRVLVIAAVGAWVGLSLLFAELRWFRRPRLTERLRRFAPAQET